MKNFVLILALSLVSISANAEGDRHSRIIEGKVHAQFNKKLGYGRVAITGEAAQRLYQFLDVQEVATDPSGTGLSTMVKEGANFSCTQQMKRPNTREIDGFVYSYWCDALITDHGHMEPNRQVHPQDR